MQILLKGQGKNFCAGIDFSALNSINNTINVPCPGRAREALRRHILKWQVQAISVHLLVHLPLQHASVHMHVCMWVRGFWCCHDAMTMWSCLLGVFGYRQIGRVRVGLYHRD